MTTTTAYCARLCSVASTEQVSKLALCGIDPAVFGDDVDPGFLAMLAPGEPAHHAVDLTDFVATAHTLVLEQPIKLGQELTLSGTLQSDEAEDGLTLVSGVALANAGGRRVFSAKAVLFRRNPNAPRTAARAGLPPPVGTHRLASVCFTPDAVVAYGGRQGNPIHFDTVAAERAGFRAPIVGGTHGLHFLTSAAWAQLRERPIAFDVAFSRPIFWDDRCDVVAGPEGDGSFDLVRDGKKLVGIRIRSAGQLSSDDAG